MPRGYELNEIVGELRGESYRLRETAYISFAP